jgi:hypothetical protein
MADTAAADVSDWNLLSIHIRQYAMYPSMAPTIGKQARVRRESPLGSSSSYHSPIFGKGISKRRFHAETKEPSQFFSIYKVFQF